MFSEPPQSTIRDTSCRYEQSHMYGTAVPYQLRILCSYYMGKTLKAGSIAYCALGCAERHLTCRFPGPGNETKRLHACNCARWMVLPCHWKVGPENNGPRTMCFRQILVPGPECTYIPYMVGYCGNTTVCVKVNAPLYSNLSFYQHKDLTQALASLDFQASL